MSIFSPLNKNREDHFTGPMYRRLCLPALASSFGWALSDMADAVVVGQRLGTVGLAAIGLILPIYMINCMFAHGFGLGGSVRYARLLSEGRHQEAQDNFRQVLSLSLLFSLATAVLGLIFLRPLLAVLGTRPTDGALFLATKGYVEILLAATPLFYLSNLLNYYLRNDGSQRRAGVGSVVGNLCDIGLNVLLVLGFGLGTRGAALSTALGQIITIAIYLPGLFRRGSTLRLGLPKGGMRPLTALSRLWAGLATSVQYLYQMIFFLMCNNILIRLGGETGVAVFDVLQNASYLILYLYEGINRAMQPLLSTYQGEHNTAGRRMTARLGFLSGLGLGWSLVLMVALWPQGMCLIFGIGGSAAEEMAVYALRVYCVGAVFAGLNILLCGYYQSCELERPAFLIETLRGGLLLIPLTLLLAQFGLGIFWWLFPATELGTLLLFLLLARGGRYAVPAVDPDRVFHRNIISSQADVGQVSLEIVAFCGRWKAEFSQQYFVTMTVEELGLAILTHGFQGREDGYLQITLIAQESGLFELHMRDNATTFDPFSLETNQASRDGDFDVDAMGVLVIKRKAKDFFYRRYQGFNTLVVKI